MAQKQDLKTQNEDLEKIIFKSDKVISHLFNSVSVLSKSVGKMLHNLLLNTDFDMKEVLEKMMTTNISKIHDWIAFFEGNAFLKKHKIYRKMNEKLNFYSKLEIPVLQDAVNRLGASLKDHDKLASFGEFSILNISHRQITNNSLSASKSRTSNKNTSEIKQEIGDPSDFLENFGAELDSRNVLPSLSLEDLIQKLIEKISSVWFNDMPIKSVKEMIDNLKIIFGKIIRKNKVEFRTIYVPRCAKGTIQ